MSIEGEVISGVIELGVRIAGEIAADANHASKHKRGGAAKKMNIETFNAKKEEILRLMAEYMNGAGDCGYKLRHIKKCGKILDTYYRELSACRGIFRNNKAILKCAEKAILALNALNKKCGNRLIETDQREELAPLIEKAAFAAGLTEYGDGGDFTAEWREW